MCESSFFSGNIEKDSLLQKSTDVTDLTLDKSLPGVINKIYMSGINRIFHVFDVEWLLGSLDGGLLRPQGQDPDPNTIIFNLTSIEQDRQQGRD